MKTKMLSTKLNNKKAKYSKAKKTNTSTIVIKINNPRIIIKIAILIIKIILVFVV
ncbi:MAG: hypothetical protein ACLU5J_11900 [Christensenellales bacterium]